MSKLLYSVLLSVVVALSIYAIVFIFHKTIGRFVLFILVKNKILSPDYENNPTRKDRWVQRGLTFLTTSPFFIWIYVAAVNEAKHFAQTGVLTVAEVYEVGMAKKFCYVNPKTRKKTCAQEGIFFSYLFVSIPSIEVGDKFLVAFEPDKPTQHRIVWSKKLDKNLKLGTDLDSLIDRQTIYIPPMN